MSNGAIYQFNVNIKAVFGRQVKHYRLKAGLTQAAASQRCGIYQNYLSRIEGGLANPTLLVMNAMAETLHIDLYKLLFEPSGLGD